MGRPPSNGGPSFRFTQPEIAEMESILQAHKTAMPERQVLVNLSEKFSNSEERKGKIEVQMKQVWNWFQNRRYAIRAKAAKYPGKLNITQMPRDDSAAIVKGVTQPHAAASSATVRSFPQPPQQPTVPSVAVRTFPQAPPHPAFSVQNAGRVTDNSQMEYEAKSARDGAWYDVSTFLSHRSLETGDPEVMVRFAGFGAEEDEWVNVRKSVRQRSLPCEASECVAVLPADLILCFQEGKEQALYFDAHVLDAQRRRHDVRGCRCRFLVRYDHDQSEEIVALRKICRRPETDYRLQQLHAVNEFISVNQNKNGANSIHTVSTLRVYPPAEVQPKQNEVKPVGPATSAEGQQKRQRLDSTVLQEGSVVLAAPPGYVPQNQQRVQPVVDATLAQPLVEPPKVEPVVPVSSAQDLTESKSVLPTVHSQLDEVPVELQKVQPVMPDPSNEVLEEHHKAEAVGPTVPAELPEIQSDEPDQPDTSAIETKPEEPVVLVSTNDHPNVVQEALETKTLEPVVLVSTNDHPNVVQEAIEEPMVLVSTNDPNVVQEAEIETKTEEPVPINDPNVAEEAIETETEEHVMPANNPNVIEAEIEKPNLCETMENNEEKHAEVAENVNDNKVENSDLASENAAVAMEEG